MIKIKVSSEKWNEIKKIHWEWVRHRFLEINKGRIKQRIKELKTELNISDEKEFEKIITGDINLLLKYQKEIGLKAKIRKPDNKAPKSKKDEYNKKKTVFDFIWNSCGYDDFLKILDGTKWYDKFKKDYVAWNVLEYVNKLSFDSCPYCNENYVYIIKDENGKKITCCEIDHFISKAKYPYLSCSICNLVPSCHNCNFEKSADTREIIYPFDEEYGENGVFRISFSKKEIPFNAANCNNINIKIKTQLKKNVNDFNDVCNQFSKINRIEKTKELLHIEDRYGNHKIDMEDLFTRYRNYSKPKIDEITKLILNEQLDIEIPELNEEQKKSLKEQLYQRVASTYTKRIKRTILGLPLGAEGKEYPLRKFKEDIIEQLDQTVKNMRK